MIDFTAALLQAEQQFNARLHHPLRDTQINDVPVIAAEMACWAAGNARTEAFRDVLASAQKMTRPMLIDWLERELPSSLKATGETDV